MIDTEHPTVVEKFRRAASHQRSELDSAELPASIAAVLAKTGAANY